MDKNNNNNNNSRKTPAEFCKILNIKVLDYSSQFSDLEFSSQLLSSEEFLNRISNCVIDKSNTKLTRRAAFEEKKKLMNKLS